MSKPASTAGDAEDIMQDIAEFERGSRTAGESKPKKDDVYCIGCQDFHAAEFHLLDDQPSTHVPENAHSDTPKQSRISSDTQPVASDSELRKRIAAIQNRQYDRELTIAEAIEQLMALIKADREAYGKEQFKHGQRVGQYQAADKLYGYVTTLWVFKDENDEKTKSINTERADGLLKDCEKYMNHNRKDYTRYLATLKASQQTKDKGDLENE